MTPGAGVFVLGCGHISLIVKLHYFLKNRLLYSLVYIRQTKYLVMMTKEGSTKIVTFMSPGQIGFRIQKHIDDSVIPFRYH